MLPEVPDDPAALASLEIELRRLPDDSPRSSPVPIADIIEYLRLESTRDELAPRDLRFLRTAVIDEAKYWIWEFNESDGVTAYATVSQAGADPPTVGYDDNFFELSPEQFIVGDYYRLF